MNTTQERNVNPYPLPPSIPLAELRRRHLAVAASCADAGSGTLLDRVRDFDRFLQHGPWLAALHRAGWDTEPVASLCPGLIDLACEAWPGARMSSSGD